MFEIIRYSQALKTEWDTFVRSSKNGTFLLLRDYMDYHSDRFSDHSLMFYKGSRLHSIMPAHSRTDGTFCSHLGLTYGGLLMDYRTTADEVCVVFHQLNHYLRQAGFHRGLYRAIPWIYHRLPAEEDLYALWHECHATIVDRSVGSVLMPHNRLPLPESRRSGLRKAQRLGLQVEEATDAQAFWPLLEQNLQQRYQSKPVHNLQEMQLLKKRFPEQIRIYHVTSPSGQLLGGTVLYLTPQVVRTQYISASPEGKRQGAIDLLFYHLLHHRYADHRYFDFGTSMQAGAIDINPSLLFQKEGFGARAVCYDTYEWEV